MTNKNDENEEPIDLHFLQRTVNPPTDLEDRVVSELRYRRLISSNIRSLSIRRIATVIAACLAFFIAGMLYQKYFVAADVGRVPSMSDSTFVLFLMEGSEYMHPNGDHQQQERISAYRNWAIDLRKRGIPISGTKLRDDKNLLGGVRIGNRQDEISGYFLIDAQNSNEAMEIARKCPHLQYGGTIEIRQVHPV